MLKKYLNIYKRYEAEAAFFVKLVGFYFLISTFFLFLTGISIPGGRLYAPFFESVNFIEWNTKIILEASNIVLNTLNFNTFLQKDILGITGKSSVKLLHACLGFQIISGYAALILAFPTKAKLKIQYLALGILVVQIINIIRVSGLVFLYSFREKSTLLTIDQHDLFNWVAVSFIILVFYFFLRATKK